MSFLWTPTDPLYGSAVSLSIYLKELQDAIDSRRFDIGQSPYIGFRNVNVDSTATLEALEQLKFVTNKLAIDYGYAGGVTHIDLLGRAWATYGMFLGRFKFSYQIINDLRLVLNSLEDQSTLEKIETLIHSWYGGPYGVNKPIAGYTSENTTPWSSIPELIQLGAGTVGEEGYPDFDNTIPGFYTGKPLVLTDRSLISFDSTYTYFMEGNVGEEYQKVSDLKSDIVHLGPWLFDKEWVYSTAGNGGSGGRVLRASRDGSVHKYDFGDFGEYFFGSGGNIGAGILGDNLIFTFAQNLTANIKVGIMDKNTGAIISIKNHYHQDLQNSGAGHNMTVKWGSGQVSNGVFYVSYKEYMNDGVFGTRTHYSSSCIVGFDSSGDIVSQQYIATASLQAPYHPQDIIRYMHEIGSVSNATSTGIYFTKSKNGEVITINTPIVNLGNILTYNDNEITDTIDYKGDTITDLTTIMHASKYTQYAGNTPDVESSELISVTRSANGEEFEAKWSHTLGNFRYQLYERETGAPAFSPSTTPVWSKDVLGAGTFTRTMTGFNDAKGYDIKLVSISAQGEKDSTVLSFPPAPVKPGKPTNLVLAITGGDKILYTWDDPIEGEPHTGFRIVYQNMSMPGSTIVDVGLVNTYTTPSLPSGTYIAGVEAYNALGGSGYLASTIIVP